VTFNDTTLYISPRPSKCNITLLLSLLKGCYIQIWPTRKVTNIFKSTNLKIAFRATNTTQSILKTHSETTDIYKSSGIYSLQCKTCKRHYVGQTGRNLAARFSDHTRYIKNNDPKSAYALHILDNRHEYGPIQDTMQLIKPCSKCRNMNIMENLYIQIFHRQGILIDEQFATERNPLFQLIDHTPPTPSNTRHSIQGQSPQNIP
jgi:hypothetical protein